MAVVFWPGFVGNMREKEGARRGWHWERALRWGGHKVRSKE